jgi:hypothetical protein
MDLSSHSFDNIGLSRIFRVDFPGWEVTYGNRYFVLSLDKIVH